MILCCGEALIDMLQRAVEDGRTAYMPVAGGAIFNTAITLGRLGEESALITGISTDLFGDYLVTALEEAGVDHSHCVRSQRPSTLAFVTLTDGHAEYSFFDENSAGRMISGEDLQNVPAAQAAHFGAISLIGEPCGTAFEALAHRLHDNTIISFDPNIRPSFIVDETAYRGRIERMAAIADILKISEDDFEWLYPGRPFDKMARDWLAQNAKLVVLTRGEHGIRVRTRSDRIDLPSAKTAVADTVGAGDSFNGGLLAGLRRSGLLDREKLANIQSSELVTALQFAIQVAAITVSRPGADPPWLKEMN